jgi:F-type H+-transporting ATPase subunit b
MNLNATLIGQMLSFALLVWFTMKVVWPPLMRAMEERQKRIADGIAASDRAKHDLELAQKKASEILKEARDDASTVLTEAGKQASKMVEEAKLQARTEGDRLIHAAKAEIALEAARAKETLRQQVALLAVAGASRILEKEVDKAAHGKLLEAVAREL